MFYPGAGKFKFIRKRLVAERIVKILDYSLVIRSEPNVFLDTGIIFNRIIVDFYVCNAIDWPFADTKQYVQILFFSVGSDMLREDRQRRPDRTKNNTERVSLAGERRRRIPGICRRRRSNVELRFRRHLRDDHAADIHYGQGGQVAGKAPRSHSQRGRTHESAVGYHRSHAHRNDRQRDTGNERQRIFPAALFSDHRAYRHVRAFNQIRFRPFIAVDDMAVNAHHYVFFIFAGDVLNVCVKHFFGLIFNFSDGPVAMIERISDFDHGDFIHFQSFKTSLEYKSLRSCDARPANLFCRC